MIEKDNPTLVLTRFIKALDIPVTRQSISDELGKHADYYSLRAFSDVLDRWNVPNDAYKLSFEELYDVPVPFIAHLSKKEFGLVTLLDENKAIVSTHKWNNKALPIDEFKKLYSGSILLAEKEERSGEPDYAAKRRQEQINDLRMPVFFTGTLFLLVSYILLQANAFLIPVLPIAIAMAGLAVSVLLLVQSIDANNPLVQKLCGSDDGRNCNAILSSKAAKVTRWLSLSEIGFFYFAGNLLVLLFGSGHTALIHALAILNLVSLLFTFYSIYYQWQIAKQWCVLCCAVQALLWLQFVALLPYLAQPRQVLNFSEWYLLIAGMAIPVLGWIPLKPLLLEARQQAALKIQIRAFKYNIDLFNKLLNDEMQYALLAAEYCLIIGNPNAAITITMVANPYCQPCAKAHKALQWMDGRDDIKLQVIFSTSAKESDKKVIVASHLLSIQNTRDATTVKKAMHDWYEQKQKNFEDWAKNYPAEKATNVIEQLEKQREWCKLAEISDTPTLFINGRRLPKNYQPEDIKYFI